MGWLSVFHPVDAGFKWVNWEVNLFIQPDPVGLYQVFKFLFGWQV